MSGLRVPDLARLRCARALRPLRALRTARPLRRLRAAGRPAFSPRLRRRLLVLAALCLVLAGGYRLWLRDSSLVAVEQVRVTGLTTADAERVRVALTSAGRGMTTLNLDREALDRAIAPYPVVRGLRVSADFPHELSVRVVEHHPVAMAVGGFGRLPVAGDGTILRGLPVKGALPTVDVSGAVGGERLRDPAARAAAAVAGAVPGVLRARVDKVVSRAEDGLVAELDEGPVLIFGSAARAEAKWAAAARVLADPQAGGAAYIDLRIPSRPAAGGLSDAPVAPVAPDPIVAPAVPIPGVTATPTEVPPAGAGAATVPTETAPAPTAQPVAPSVTQGGAAAPAAP